MTQGVIRAKAEVPLAAPAARVDLAAWLRGMTGAEYQACAFGHIALGHDPDGRGMVNVEWIGGALIIHRYRVLSAGPAEVLLESPRSLVLVMNVVPLWLRVRWRMRAEAAPDRLLCDVEVFAHPLIRALAEALLLRWTLGLHVRAEARGFARSVDCASGGKTELAAQPGGLASANAHPISDRGQPNPFPVEPDHRTAQRFR